MINKSIIKLIDEAIFPAMALIVAKMAGLLATAYFMRLNFTIHEAKILSILPAVTFKSISDYQLAENYSNLAMFTVVAFGTLVVLIRAHYFHSSHIKPSLHTKLLNLSLANLVVPTYHIYHQAVIWLIYLWLVVAFLLISSAQQVTYNAVTIIAFIIAANFSWIFAIDVEREIEISRNS